MRKILLILTAILSASVLNSCAFLSAPNEDGTTINKIAIVSFAVSDWSGSVRAGNLEAALVAKLITTTATKMLEDTEALLATKWNVVKVSSFIKSNTYRGLSSTVDLSVIVPKINGQEMSVFTDVSSEIKAGEIDSQIAMNLCEALDVDGVALIFSEWTVNTGGAVPMTRAVTNNVFSVWDINGRLHTKKRVDMMGNKPLVLNGFKAVNENTISEWQNSFNRAMDRIIHSI